MGKVLDLSDPHVRSVLSPVAITFVIGFVIGYFKAHFKKDGVLHLEDQLEDQLAQLRYLEQQLEGLK